MKDRSKKTQNTVDRITEEELRASLDDLRRDMEAFSGHYYKNFEEAYKDLFGDGLEPEVEKTKVSLTIDGETIEVDPDDTVANFYLRKILCDREDDVKIKVGKLSFVIPAAEDTKKSSKKSSASEDDFEEVDLDSDDGDADDGSKAKILSVIPVGRSKAIKVKAYEIKEAVTANGKKKNERFFICLGRPDGTVLYRNEERAEETGDAVWLKIKTAKGPFKPGKTREIIHTATTEKYADYDW